jgi:hypothetical protein
MSKNLIILKYIVIIGIVYVSLLYLYNCSLVEGFTSRPRVVISLTTIPSRINEIEKCLHSLLNQTFKVDKIYLNIPYYSTREDKDYVIPLFLEKMAAAGKISLIRCRDMGPATKLIPILPVERDPETCIVIIDDDRSVELNVVELLVNGAKKYPNSAITLCGRTIKEDQLLYHTPGDHTVDIVQGFSGVLFKRKFIDDTIYEYTDYSKHCFYVDDVWFSGHLAKKGIPRQQVAGHIGKPEYHDKNALYKIEGTYSRTNADAKCIIDFREKHKCW